MIKLRPIEESDLRQLKEWRNTDSVRDFTREWRLLSDNDQEEWWNAYCKNRKNVDSGQELMIIMDDRNMVGVGGFVRIEWRNRRAEFSFYIGSDSHRDEENIKKAQKLLLKKAFNEMNLHKVYWPVYSHDPNSVIYSKYWDLEAILKEEYFWNGEWNDRIYLSNLKDSYESAFA